MKLHLMLLSYFCKNSCLKKKAKLKKWWLYRKWTDISVCKNICNYRSYLKEIYLHLKVKHFKEGNSVGNGSASLEYDQILWLL